MRNKKLSGKLNSQHASKFQKFADTNLQDSKTETLGEIFIDHFLKKTQTKTKPTMKVKPMTKIISLTHSNVPANEDLVMSKKEKSVLVKCKYKFKKISYLAKKEYGCLKESGKHRMWSSK